MSSYGLEADVSATFATVDWYTKSPVPREPFSQLAGVLPRKRQNTQFLDSSNTWLITSNIDMRPPANFHLRQARALRCPFPQRRK